MNRRFSKDLTRWEAGGLSEAQLAIAYPRVDVAGITDLYDQLAHLATEPAPDPETTWEALRSRLPERARVESLGWRTRRAMVAAVAAALLGGTSIAYAAGLEQVRDTVDAITGGIRSLFDGSSGEPPPPAPVEDDANPKGDGGQEPELDDPQVVGRDEDDPDADGPDPEDPDDEEPDDDEPDTDEPDTDEPDTDEPDTDEPDTDEPDTDEPDTDEPDTEEPDED